MTETEAPPPADTMTLADAFAMVEVTPGDAIGLLNSLAEGFTDKHPELSAALNKAIVDISSGKSSADTEEAAEPEVVTEDSPPV